MLAQLPMLALLHWLAPDEWRMALDSALLGPQGEVTQVSHILIDDIIACTKNVPTACLFLSTYLISIASSASQLLH